jgi:(hydroxyamino)benzene mutase
MSSSRNIETSSLQARQGQRLLQIGVGLLLLTSFWGFFFPHFASPPLGLSAHKLTSLAAVLLLVLGLAWHRLELGAGSARIAFWLLLYSVVAIIAAYVLGSIWGAGNETMPLAAGNARGTDLQETVIRIVAYSSGPTGIVAFVLILWGLRRVKTR